MAKPVTLERKCRVYQGSLDRDGYGRPSLAGFDGRRRQVRLHRWVWEQVYGPIPHGILVRHKCDTPGCFLLDHLELGTHADNAKDREDRGRGVRAPGERNGKAKLTAAAVREIRQRCADGETQAAIAADYGVDRSLISYVHHGKLWRDA